jgi:hypothetical protein
MADIPSESGGAKPTRPLTEGITGPILVGPEYHGQAGVAGPAVPPIDIVLPEGWGSIYDGPKPSPPPPPPASPPSSS